MIKRQDVERFIRLVEGPMIGGDPVAGSRKGEFRRLGMKVLKSFAADYLHLPAGSYEVRFNAGGVAVSGEVTLHGERLYVQFSQFGLGGDPFMWRTCQGQKDYTGGPNRWAPFGSLLDMPRLALEMEREFALTANSPR